MTPLETSEVFVRANGVKRKSLVLLCASSKSSVIAFLVWASIARQIRLIQWMSLTLFSLVLISTIQSALRSQRMETASAFLLLLLDEGD